MLVGVYNRLVGLRQNANQAFADIDVQLKQRQDLVPNLVETVKGYVAHESGTLEAVTRARNAAASASSVEDKVQAENVLTGALRQLMAVSEAYPDLKANAGFMQLQDELTDIENKIAAAPAVLQQRGQRVQRLDPAVPGGSIGLVDGLPAARLLRPRRQPRRGRDRAPGQVLGRGDFTCKAVEAFRAYIWNNNLRSIFPAGGLSCSAVGSALWSPS